MIPVLDNNHNNENFIRIYKKYKKYIKSKKMLKYLKLFKESYIMDNNNNDLAYYSTILLKLKYELIKEIDIYSIIGIIALIIHILSIYFNTNINMYNIINYSINEQTDFTYFNEFKLMLIAKIDEILEKNKCTIKYEIILNK
ncbi:ORF MSV031 hypothetical protein [Melanoplus sanguinipes entomopoxvirus]|uniref:Uncharacterized protein n=1 Tax=Melanoplus sanguinipes entomopoxvirus TaxID=83191 RepID=Q9YW61_MSEPV|nr:ORF MSV031 hypothetical protein [Melanoplus sanguinipes entomopoxvirus]AAC97841.1 ORF MSV031 hypothetical protein [Melanoplus sanguinipes entomopoxvirus 'O']